MCLDLYKNDLIYWMNLSASLLGVHCVHVYIELSTFTACVMVTSCTYWVTDNLHLPPSVCDLALFNLFMSSVFFTYNMLYSKY